jgi:hypothetical protein
MTKDDTAPVTGIDFAGNTRVLRGMDDERLVNAGDTVLTFRGEEVTLLGGTPPHKDGSTGRIVVQYADKSRSEFFPSVCDLYWK